MLVFRFWDIILSVYRRVYKMKFGYMIFHVVHVRVKKQHIVRLVYEVICMFIYAMCWDIRYVIFMTRFNVQLQQDVQLHRTSRFKFVVGVETGGNGCRWMLVGCVNVVENIRQFVFLSGIIPDSSFKYRYAIIFLRSQKI